MEGSTWGMKWGSKWGTSLLAKWRPDRGTTLGSKVWALTKTLCLDDKGIRFFVRVFKVAYVSSWRPHMVN